MFLSFSVKQFKVKVCWYCMFVFGSFSSFHPKDLPLSLFRLFQKTWECPLVLPQFQEAAGTEGSSRTAWPNKNYWFLWFKQNGVNYWWVSRHVWKNHIELWNAEANSEATSRKNNEKCSRSYKNNECNTCNQEIQCAITVITTLAVQQLLNLGERCTTTHLNKINPNKINSLSLLFF